MEPGQCFALHACTGTGGDAHHGLIIDQLNPELNPVEQTLATAWQAKSMALHPELQGRLVALVEACWGPGHVPHGSPALALCSPLFDNFWDPYTRVCACAGAGPPQQSRTGEGTRDPLRAPAFSQHKHAAPIRQGLRSPPDGWPAVTPWILRDPPRMYTIPSSHHVHDAAAFYLGHTCGRCAHGWRDAQRKRGCAPRRRRRPSRRGGLSPRHRDYWRWEQGLAIGFMSTTSSHAHANPRIPICFRLRPATGHGRGGHRPHKRFGEKGP